MKKKYLRLQCVIEYDLDVLLTSIGTTDLGDGDNGGIWSSDWNL